MLPRRSGLQAMILKEQAIPTSDGYDVAIIGGALSGTATAILLLRENPSLRVIIIEKSTAFSRRVGEATVEVSGYFLCRVLGLTQYLNESHLVKQGMRFWFFDEKTKSLPECSEIGGRYLSRVPAFQVDRSSLDEELLRRTKEMGATVLRPASVSKVALEEGGQQVLEVRSGEQSSRISARWVVDASGVAAMLARQNGWWRANEAHPTTAVWSRWTGVKDWDGYALSQKFPEWSMACHGVRATATNHLVGKGWWAWIIPLKGGDVSIGVVFDQRLMEFPEEGALGQRLKDFLLQHPVGRELMADANWREGDVHWRKNLPYYSTVFAGDGFALVGDAAGFLDPFYSPGMDWISYTSYTVAQLIAAQQKGEPLAAPLAKHNRDFATSYQRWFEALYQDKYEYMGEYDLMRLGFMLDLGFYYMGVASQPFRRGIKAFAEPPFSTRVAKPFYYFIRFYNRRLAKIARRRRLRNGLAQNNHGKRFLIPGFTFTPINGFRLGKYILGWMVLEVREGWRTWFTTRPVAEANIKRAPISAANPLPAKS